MKYNHASNLCVVSLLYHNINNYDNNYIDTYATIPNITCNFFTANNENQ